MISETTLRSYVPHTSHFRFPNTLQNLGSGTGKPSILRDQKPIRKRDPAQQQICARAAKRLPRRMNERKGHKSRIDGA